MFRDLLVHVDGSQAGRSRLQLAVGLAVRMGARLSGIQVTPAAEVPPLYKPSLVEQVALDLTTQLAFDARAAAVVFREETTVRLADARWFDIHGDVAVGISNKARYADLVILGQYEWQGSPLAHPLPIGHSVVLQCGRPVLVVPAVVQQSSFERVAIAWDGSREAVRAVHDALPLLCMAKSVQIVTIITPSELNNEDDAASLLAHLAKHGITGGTDALQFRAEDEHHLLQKQIEQGKYDLLVMGGYSHPRWLEFIFGGATKSVLLSSNIPVLVSH
jgi:nucleotide-binding universal stress UspA family protein